MSGALQSNMPRRDTPMVDEAGRPTYTWYWFLIQLFNRTGASTPSQGIVGAVSTAFNVFLITIGSLTRAMLGGVQQGDGTVVQDVPTKGVAVQVLTVGASPWVHTVTFQGTLVVQKAQVELSRDSGVTWYEVGLQGGAIPMLAYDQVRLTWYGTSVPGAIFFPSGST